MIDFCAGLRGAGDHPLPSRPGAGRSLRGRRNLRAVGLSLAGLLVTATAAAGFAQTHYRIDPAKSQVNFSLKGFHNVEGHFAVSSGDMTFDRTSGAMGGSVEVAAASADSGEPSRDKKIDKDEMKTKKFPTVTFVPTKFTGTLAPAGTSTIQVEGTFTLLGKPHPINVPMTVDIQGTDCTAKGSFVVPYIAWGMKDPSNFMMHMDKQVTVQLNFTGTLSQ
jgi:polyisoprenoid-binding protein YceI